MLIYVLLKPSTTGKDIALQDFADWHSVLYKNQINARALIGQSAIIYCAGKPTEKSRGF